MFPSTTWPLRPVRITRAPVASGHSVPKGHRWRRLPARNPRNPLTITVKWRGGSEAWVEVHARGDVARLPGWIPISDLVLMVNSNGLDTPGPNYVKHRDR